MTEVKEVMSEQACVRMMWTHGGYRVQVQPFSPALLSSQHRAYVPSRFLLYTVGEAKSFLQLHAVPSHRQLFQQLKCLRLICAGNCCISPLISAGDLWGCRKAGAAVALFWEESVWDTSLQERSFRMGQGISRQKNKWQRFGDFKL